MLALAPVSALAAQPEVTLDFADGEIDIGLDTSLQIAVDASEPVNDLSFSLDLPSELTVAAVSGLTTTCPGEWELQGDTLSVSIDRLASPCTAHLWVTSVSGGGLVTATTSTVTWSGSQHAPASASIELALQRGELDAYFEPSSVTIGESARLYYTIGLNSGFGSTSFTHTLPDHATVGVSSTDCDRLTVTNNSVYLSKFFSDGGSCTGWVEVTPTESLSTLVGPLAVTPQNYQMGSKAVALSVNTGPVRAVVTNDPVVPGGSAALEVTLLNRERSFEATDITWSIDLDAGLAGLKASSLPTEPCGSGSALSGLSTISLTGGSIPSEGSCTFVIPLSVPETADLGVGSGTTAPAAAQVDGSSVEWAGAPWHVRVSPLVTLSAEAVDSPATPGDELTVNYTLTNLGSEAVSSIAFSQALDALQSTVSLPSNGVCGSGSTFLTTPSTPDVPFTFYASQMALGAAGGSDDSCTFQVVYNIPATFSSGRYDIPTGPVSAVAGGEGLQVPGAPLSFEIISAPKLSLQVREAAVAPGDTATFDMVLEANENISASAIDTTFSLDLDGALTGLDAVGLPLSDVCGPGSSLATQGGVVTLTGATVEPSSSCAFSFETLIPGSTAPGDYALLTSGVSASIDGTATTSPPSSTTLRVGDSPMLDVSFSKAVVSPSGDVDITYVVRNLDSVPRDVTIQDRITDTFSGAAFDAAPGADWCNSQSTATLLSNNTYLVLTAPLQPGDECTATATLSAGTTLGELTHSVPMSYGPSTTTGSASLRVQPALEGILDVSPALSGQTIPAEFTFSAPDADVPGTGIAFTLPLDDALEGLVAVGLPRLDVCGQGSVLTGTDTIILVDGVVNGGDTCSFTVDLAVPETAVAPASYPLSTTSFASSTGEHDALEGLLELRLCRDGYGATDEPGFCDDVDECASGEHTCDVNATCSNTEGGFSCECLDGFIGDGQACADIDECTENTHDCSDRATCTNEAGGFGCECPEGTEGPDCDSVCGDGQVVFEEDCDDGNDADDDGCSAACEVEPGFACTGEPSTCEATCGDGVLDDGEDCDDGDLDSGDGCDDTCKVEPGFACTGEPSVCEATCGDGVLDDGEACDDGNLDDDDGCSSSCVVEPGYECTGEPSDCELDCDANPAACAGECGDGVVDDGEECDDGAANSEDGPCSPDCEAISTDTGSDTATDTAEGSPSGCGCSSQGSGSFFALLLPLMLLRRRRA